MACGLFVSGVVLTWLERFVGVVGVLPGSINQRIEPCIELFAGAWQSAHGFRCGRHIPRVVEIAGAYAGSYAELEVRGSVARRPCKGNAGACQRGGGVWRWRRENGLRRRARGFVSVVGILPGSVGQRIEPCVHRFTIAGQVARLGLERVKNAQQLRSKLEIMQMEMNRI